MGRIVSLHGTIFKELKIKQTEGKQCFKGPGRPWATVRVLHKSATTGPSQCHRFLSLEGDLGIFIPVPKEGNRGRSCVPGKDMFKASFPQGILSLAPGWTLCPVLDPLPGWSQLVPATFTHSWGLPYSWIHARSLSWAFDSDVQLSPSSDRPQISYLNWIPHLPPELASALISGTVFDSHSLRPELWCQPRSGQCSVENQNQ